MLALSVQSPAVARPAPERGVVERALRTAGTVSGAYAASPVRFRRLEARAGELAAGLRPGAAGAWVLVSVAGSLEAGHRAHLRERSLTAAQRFMLALACDGVENAWVDEAVPDVEAFRSAGLDLAGEEPVGLVWCAEG